MRRRRRREGSKSTVQRCIYLEQGTREVHQRRVTHFASCHLHKQTYITDRQPASYVFPFMFPHARSHKPVSLLSRAAQSFNVAGRAQTNEKRPLTQCMFVCLSALYEHMTHISPAQAIEESSDWGNLTFCSLASTGCIIGTRVIDAVGRSRLGARKKSTRRAQ